MQVKNIIQCFEAKRNKRFNKIDRLNKEINYNDLNYTYKSGCSINFETFVKPKDFCDRIKNSEITLEYAKLG